jgi:alpha-amylase
MKKRAFGVLLVILFTLLIAPVTASPTAQELTGTDGLPWWNDRVFYEVFVRAFEDSDGDGNGDIPGLISKLDYLNDGDPSTDSDLGVTGIWLMPIMQSPSYHGYDVTDYEQIESDYGTNNDFKQLIAEAHQRGIAVIVDMVLNHTSNEHPWFIDSETPASAHDSWYRWSLTNPGYPGPWGAIAWHQAGNRYYYGVFWEGMPDLNLNNPAVTQAVYQVADFWLNDMGVDGFRLDAIKHLIEEGQKQESTPSTLRWLEKWNQHIDDVKPDAFTVGEVFGGSGSVLSLYVPDTVDTIFDFGIAGAILNSVQSRTATNITNVQNQVLDLYPPGQYAAFLTNHDQNRVMNGLNSVDKNKIAASILLTQPGVPFVYYGEEIGMIGLKPDECIRTPFQWDETERTAPFMAGKNCRTNEAEFNLATQVDDPDSLFNHYRTLIHLRNDHSALRVGDITTVHSASTHVYSFIRHNATETLLVLANLSDESVSDYALTLETGSLAEVSTINLILGQGEPTAPTVNAAGGFDGYTPLPELAPYSTTVIQLS